MSDNIYDNEAFFTGYSQLPRSVHGLDGAPEWPTLRSMVGDVASKRLVDLGCGYGWFCRWAVEADASSVTGIDVSERMLVRATADTNNPRVEYRKHNLEEVELGENKYDLAYSSLTFHYLQNIERLFSEIQTSLEPGGRLVFSVEHPLFTAPRSPGFVSNDEGTQVWPVDAYLDEGPRTTNWLAPGVVKQHRTIAGYLSALHAAGFRLLDLVEWGPSAQQIAAVPEWALERERPPFLLIAAEAETMS